MTNMFENKCGVMFDMNNCFMTSELSNISDKVLLNQTSLFSMCMAGGFRIPFNDIKDEECSPHAWG